MTTYPSMIIRDSEGNLFYIGQAAQDLAFWLRAIDQRQVLCAMEPAEDIRPALESWFQTMQRMQGKQYAGSFRFGAGFGIGIVALRLSENVSEGIMRLATPFWCPTSSSSEA